MKERISASVEKKTLDAFDKARGLVPRSRIIESLILELLEKKGDRKGLPRMGSKKSHQLPTERGFS